MSHKAQSKPQKHSPYLPGGPSATQRLTVTEKEIKSLTSSLDAVRQVLAANKPILDAIVEILGAQTVVDMVRTQHVRNLRAQNETRTAAMVKLIASGTFVRTDTVAQESVVLTEETDADGVVLEPGRTYDSVGAFPAEIAAQVVGLKEGASFDTGEGRKMTVLEIYSFVGHDAAVPSDQESTSAPSERTPDSGSVTPTLVEVE